MDVTPPDSRHRDDLESPDAESFDLTPRTTPDTSADADAADSVRSTRRWLAVAALVAVVAGLGFVLVQGLGDAATFFYNVDEAVARRDDLADERFRMQGNVKAGSVRDTGEGVDFVVRFAGVEVPVRHTGTPPELFGPDIPVVLEGSFEGDGFASDEILVRHDNTYGEENPDRIAEAEADVARETDSGNEAGAGSGP